MEIEQVNIVDIVPYENNPRKNDKAVDIVAKSIKNFGFKVPIILDDKNVIVAGHTRVKAAIKLGMTSVPAIYASDLNEQQIKAFRIMDNKSIEYAEWDRDLLKQELENLNLQGFDMDLTGFEDRELNELIHINKDEEFDIDDEVEKAKQGEIIPKTGDLWQLGEHKLIVGSATDKQAWEKLLGEERFDFMFTDPPYKLAYTQRVRSLGGGKKFKDKNYLSVGQTDKNGKPIISKGRFKGKVKTKGGFGYKAQRRYLGVERAGGVPEFDEWLKIAKQYQNSKGSNIMIFENWKNTPELWGAVEKYWKIKNMIIWHLPSRCQGFSRKGFLFNKYDIAILADYKNKEVNDIDEEEYNKFLVEKGEKLVNNYEIALYSYQGDATFNRKKRKATAKVTDHITSAPDNASQSGQSLVFGTKPLQILIPYLKVLSNPQELIMEPFGGSGSTLIASEIMGRKCRVIEIEPLYAQVIIKRWEKFTGKKAIKEVQNGTG